MTSATILTAKATNLRAANVSIPFISDDCLGSYILTADGEVWMHGEKHAQLDERNTMIFYRLFVSDNELFPVEQHCTMGRNLYATDEFVNYER